MYLSFLPTFKLLSCSYVFGEHVWKKSWNIIRSITKSKCTIGKFSSKGWICWNTANWQKLKSHIYLGYRYNCSEHYGEPQQKEHLWNFSAHLKGRPSICVSAEMIILSTTLFLKGKGWDGCPSSPIHIAKAVHERITTCLLRCCGKDIQTNAGRHGQQETLEKTSPVFTGACYQQGMQELPTVMGVLHEHNTITVYGRCLV